MKKIGILLTSSAVEEVVKEYINKPLNNTFTECVIINNDILDLISRNEEEKTRELVTKEVRKFKNNKIYNIIFTCSSISSLKNIAAHEGVRIFAIDDFLIRETASFNKIDFLATTPSALENSHNLFNPYQTIKNHLIDKAFDCLLKGEKEKHNKFIENYVCLMPKDIQCIVLGQISMMYAFANISKKINIPVLSGATTLVKNLLSQKEPTGITLYDSISYAKGGDKNKLIISGSHGGISSVKYAVDKKLFGVILNDAGVGKNKAGISGLPVLENNGILGITVDAKSAEIGNAKDTYENGLVSYYNNIAKDFGIQEKMRIKDFVKNLTR